MVQDIRNTNVSLRDINSIKPYAKNPRRNDLAVAAVARSIESFGFQQPIVVDSQGVVIVGHTRLKAAHSLNLTQVPVIVAELTEAQARAYRVADNKLNDISEWDDEVLFEELSRIVADGNENLSGFTAQEVDELMDRTTVNPYTKKIDTPIYTPKGAEPQLSELVDTAHTERLIQQIDASTAPEPIKAFLRCAAQRHNRFDYEQIAEYYCHQSPEVQRLIEDSALVVIDMDRAIELGYVQLNENLKQLYAEQYDPQDPDQNSVA